MPTRFTRISSSPGAGSATGCSLTSMTPVRAKTTCREVGTWAGDIADSSGSGSIVLVLWRGGLLRDARPLTMRERCRSRHVDGARASTRLRHMTNEESAEWLNMEDFAEGIDANRLPTTEDLAGRSVTIQLADGATLTTEFDLETVT